LFGNKSLGKDFSFSKSYLALTKLGLLTREAMSYKAFISYSHAADGQLAPALQSGLQRIAKPFYRLRAMRIFRDETSLQLTPKLWPTIQHALSESEHFILMASPASANSKWVQDEVNERLRLQNGTLEKVHIVLTEGEILWDNSANDFDWGNTTALPKNLRGKFETQPLFLDFRWAREFQHLSLRNPQFLRGVGKLAAAIHEKPLDTIIGDDVKQHRVFKLAAGVTIILLSALVMIASGTAYYANERRKEALTAAHNERIAREEERTQREQAMIAKNNEQEARGQAEQRRIEAEERRAEAEKQTKIANEQRQEALQQRGRAEQQTVIAQEQRQRASTERNAAIERLARLHWSNGVYEGTKSHWLRASQHFVSSAALESDYSRAQNAKIAAYLLAGSTRLEQIYEHGASINGASLSKSEESLLTWSEDGTARIWNRRSSLPVFLSLKHDAGVNGAKFNKDETRILTWSKDGMIRVWESRTGTLLADPMKQGTSVIGAAFDNNEGRILSWGQEGPAYLWQAATGKLVAEMKHGRAIWKAFFSEDGKSIITCGDNKISLWDAETGNFLNEFNPPHGPIGDVMVVGDKLLIKIASDSTKLLRVNFSTGELREQKSLQPKQAINSAEFSHNGKLILTWGYGKAQIWDAETGEQNGGAIDAPQVRSGAFSLDDDYVLLWGSHNAESWGTVDRKKVGETIEHETDIEGAMLSRDHNSILTWSADGMLQLRTDVSGNSVMDEMMHGAGLSGAMLTNDAHSVITWGKDGAVRIWTITYNEQQSQSIEKAGNKDALFAKDGSHLITWNWGREGAKSIDLSSDNSALELGSQVDGVSYNRQGNCLVTWGRDVAQVWGVRSGQKIGVDVTLKGLRGASITNFMGAFVNDSCERIVTWGDSWGGRTTQSVVSIWDIKTGNNIRNIIATSQTAESGFVKGSHFSGAALSSDGGKVLTWGNNVRLWDVATGDPIGKPISHFVEYALLTSDSTHILTLGWDGKARMWDSQSGESIGKPMEHLASLVGAIFNSDESRILTWSEDGSARLWDARTGSAISKPMKHNGRVIGALLSQDGNKVLTWSLDDTAQLWDSNTGDAISKPMHHKKIAAASFGRSEHSILTWSSATSSLLQWTLPDLTNLSDNSSVKRLEVQTGVTLDESGQVIVLSPKQWKEKREGGTIK
jgi:WD40 repeat protein